MKWREKKKTNESSIFRLSGECELWSPGYISALQYYRHYGSICHDCQTKCPNKYSMSQQKFLREKKTKIYRRQWHTVCECTTGAAAETTTHGLPMLYYILYNCGKTVWSPFFPFSSVLFRLFVFVSFGFFFIKLNVVRTRNRLDTHTGSDVTSTKWPSDDARETEIRRGGTGHDTNGEYNTKAKTVEREQDEKKLSKSMWKIKTLVRWNSFVHSLLFLPPAPFYFKLMSKLLLFFLFGFKLFCTFSSCFVPIADRCSTCVSMSEFVCAHHAEFLQRKRGKVQWAKGNRWPFSK